MIEKIEMRRPIRLPDGYTPIVQNSLVNAVYSYLQRRNCAIDANDKYEVALEASRLVARSNDPTWVDWLVENGKEEYSGKLPKRLAKALKKIRPDVPFNSESIGASIQHLCSGRSGLWFDWTDQFDWCAGDFGDGSVCYWGGYHHSSYRHARAVIAWNYGLAFRLFKFEGNLEMLSEGERRAYGWGRCWALVDQKYLLRRDNTAYSPREHMFTFNHYGPNKDAFIAYLKEALEIMSGEKWVSRCAHTSFNIPDVYSNHDGMYYYKESEDHLVNREETIFSDCNWRWQDAYYYRWPCDCSKCSYPSGRSAKERPGREMIIECAADVTT